MTIKEIRTLTGLSQSKFAAKYKIKVRTLQEWEQGRKIAPEHTLFMLERLVKEDFKTAPGKGKV